MAVPILDCSSHAPLISFLSNTPPSHPLQCPTLNIPSGSLRSHVEKAAGYLTDGRLVAFPTETVYGLGAATLCPQAVKSVYELKGRPSDNPLIVHVSSLDMLYNLTPPTYELSELYAALTIAFWPGPLTLLFPARHPPPPPAPQTTAIRIPSHPLARALIHISDTPVSAPSANSSGRPSPTTAAHVSNDLGQKPCPNPLGCILDGGPCAVGVESTVVNGLEWSKGKGGGTLTVLRPGGTGVEQLEEICRQIDEREGTQTRVALHGRKDTTKSPHRVASSKSHSQFLAEDQHGEDDGQQYLNPATPGMKYRHYSPSVPVYLLYPSSAFPTSSSLPSAVQVAYSSSTSPPSLPAEILRLIAAQRPGEARGPVRLGLMHYNSSPLASTLSTATAEGTEAILGQRICMGSTAEDAARALFGGMLSLEGRSDSPGECGSDGSTPGQGVDAILIEACSTEGLGLAVMERAGKAAGGGGSTEGLDGYGKEPARKSFWVQV